MKKELLFGIIVALAMQTQIVSAQITQNATTFIGNYVDYSKITKDYDEVVNKEDLELLPSFPGDVLENNMLYYRNMKTFFYDNMKKSIRKKLQKKHLYLLLQGVLEKDGTFSTIDIWLSDDIKWKQMPFIDYIYYLTDKVGFGKTIWSEALAWKSNDKKLNQEIQRLIKVMPKWNPGKVRNIPVRAYTCFLVPIMDESDSFIEFFTPKILRDEQTISEKELESLPVPDKQASFPNGGLFQFLSDNVKYPAVAEENGIEGTAICSFIVEEDGRLSYIRVVNDLDASLKKEAIRAIRIMPRWNPAIKDNKAIRSKYTLPISFRLR